MIFNCHSGQVVYMAWRSVDANTFGYDFGDDLINCISKVFITGNYIAGPGP